MRGRVYITNRTDGLTGFGTISDPYDGSTAINFDRAMRATPANTTIYLSPGIFQTSGYGNNIPNFYPQNGWYVKGAGMYKTTLQLANCHSGDGQRRKTVISMDYDRLFHNTRWENFTIDVNLDNQQTTSGICNGGMSIAGNNNIIRKVRLINLGSRAVGWEAFGINNGGIDTVTRSPFTGDIIDSCRVEQPMTGNCVDTATAILGGGTNLDDLPRIWSDGIVIKNCYINMSGYPSTTQALHCNGINCQVYDNVVENCFIGWYDDTTNIASMTFRDNQLKNVQYGVVTNYGTSTYGHIGTGYFINNYISFRDTKIVTGAAYMFSAFRFLGNFQTGSGYTFDYIVVSGNRIENNNKQLKTGSSNQNAYLFIASNLNSGVVVDNSFTIYNTGDQYYRSGFYLDVINGVITGNNYSIINYPLN